MTRTTRVYPAWEEFGIRNSELGIPSRSPPGETTNHSDRADKPTQLGGAADSFNCLEYFCSQKCPQITQMNTDPTQPPHRKHEDTKTQRNHKATDPPKKEKRGRTSSQIQSSPLRVGGWVAFVSSWLRRGRAGDLRLSALSAVSPYEGIRAYLGHLGDLSASGVGGWIEYPGSRIEHRVGGIVCGFFVNGGAPLWTF
jgi:hypothetical protein